MTQVLIINSRDPQLEIIIKAAEIIKKGGLVAFPTETVYGLGADFFNKKAIQKLCDVKQRSQAKPFTAHIADLEDMEKFNCQISHFGRELIDKFWPGPLTLIFNTNKAGKVGFRFPNDEVAQELIRQSNTVIAAPSANISGKNPPRTAREVLEQLGNSVDLILDAGETRLGKESTVIDLSVLPYRVIREGAISRQKIAETESNFWKYKVGPIIKKILFVCTGNSCRSVMAEGYLKKRLKQVERDDIEVISRGVSSPGAAAPTPQTIDVLKSESIDMSEHKSEALSKRDIEDSDLILAMEDFQLDDVLDIAPSKKDRVYLLAEFGLWGGKTQDTPLEIPDPIGKSIAAYKDAFSLIKNSIDRLVKILI